MILPKLGSEVVCWFGVFDVSPKGTEAKEASNLLAFPNLCPQKILTNHSSRF
jgi:hypothetical protein